MGELAVRNAAGGNPPGETPPGTFFRKGEHGLIELVDIKTNAVISIQKSYDDIPRAEFIETTIDGKTVLVQGGVDARHVTLRARPPFARPIADCILQRLVEGTPLSKIPDEPGMPDYYTIARWRRENPEFEAEIRFARKMRAERLRDEAIAKAQESEGVKSDFVAGYKLQVDTLKWAAEKDAPEDYGTKVEVKGQIGLVHLLVETGIRRAGDPGFVESTAKRITGSDEAPKLPSVDTEEP